MKNKKYIIGKLKIEDAHRSVLCRLPITGCPEDGTLAVYTGCTDGNGRSCIAIINEKYIEKIVSNKE